MPKVTIGIPVFNGARFIERAVRCFLNQDYADLEVIVADNASTDATVEICDAMALTDRRVTILASDRNRGAAWNYNRLVDAARGTYFKWASHDDWCTRDFVSSTVAALQSREDAVLCYARRWTENDSGCTSPGPTLDNPGLRSDDVRRRFHEAVWNLKGSNAMIFGLIRTDVLRRSGRIQNIPQPDRALLHELTLHGPFLYVDTPAYIQYISPRGYGHYADDHIPLRLRSWVWLNPDNAARPKFSLYRFLLANFDAFKRGPKLRAWDCVVMTMDLVIGTVITRLQSKRWRAVLRHRFMATFGSRLSLKTRGADTVPVRRDGGSDSTRRYVSEGK